MSATLRDGFNYTTRDGKTVQPKLAATGNYHCADTGRHFTPAGGCIAYYRGNEPIIEDHRSIIPAEVERIAALPNGPFDSSNLGHGEPPITNAERYRNTKDPGR